MAYRLLGRFESLFSGTLYNHRNSALGDSVAVELYEDLLHLDPTTSLAKRIADASRVVNLANTRRGVRARRGDGTFGEIIPNTESTRSAPYEVARGEVATVEVGVEVKIIAKAMQKQIDRVLGDLSKQTVEFRHGGGQPICVAVVGINFAEQYTSVEGDRFFPTDGKRYLHPVQEAASVEAKVRERLTSEFDELLILRFAASNSEPFDFRWLNRSGTERDYGAALVRILRQYERRF